MYRVVVTDRAERDIMDAGDYIAYTLRAPEAAFNLVSGLRRAIAALENMPERYAVVIDEILEAQKIRCMPYKNYYVFYRVDFDTVIILRVGYNRKNWKEILKNG